MLRGLSTKLYVPTFTYKDFNSPLRTSQIIKTQSSTQEEAQNQGTKPMNKAITSTQERRHKAKAQSKEKGYTTLGDRKDHKQHLSHYKILEDRICNE